MNDAIGNTLQTGNTTLDITEAGLIDTTPVAAVNAIEGNSTGNVVLATFTDGNPNAQASYFTPFVNWGGTVIGNTGVSLQQVSQGTSNSTWEVVGNATYAETGNYTVKVTVNDADGNSVQTGNSSFHVTDAPLSDATPFSTVNAVEGSGTGPVVLATFTDGNPYAQSSDFTPVVNWGGSVVGTPALSVQFVAQGSNNSTWEVVGSATYAEAGNYTPTVKVTDADGASMQTCKTTFQIADAPVNDTTQFSMVNCNRRDRHRTCRAGDVYRRQSVRPVVRLYASRELGRDGDRHPRFVGATRVAGTVRLLLGSRSGIPSTPRQEITRRP